MRRYLAMDADKALRDRDDFDMSQELSNDVMNNFCLKVRKDFDMLLAIEKKAKQIREQRKTDTELQFEN